MTNEEFLEVIRQSFKKYLEINTSRSTAKLKNLHGSIARDLEEIFGNEYTVISQGYGKGKEYKMQGRYYEKFVDITVSRKGKPIAGYAVKFVMRNYSQNSNNYFENMLGETANIRSNAIPYFQIFIVFDKVPYYEKGGKFSHYEIVSEHNLDKYIKLSKDDPNTFYHTPDKTLIILLSLKEKSPDYKFKDSGEYADYYDSIINDEKLLKYSTKIKDTFDDGIIMNDYSDFIKRTYYISQGKIKKS